MAPRRLKLPIGVILFLACFVSANSQLRSEERMLRNGDFEERPYQKENLWDGVDSEGFLSGDTGGRRDSIGPPVLGADGGIYDQALPVSVAVADLNGDGLKDIAAMDYPGWLRVYFNSGSPKAPKFTHGELAPLFLSRIVNTDPTLQWISNPRKNQDYWYARQAQRIHLADPAKSGKKSLIVGNYLGELFLIPNSGSARAPVFATPADPGQALLKTSKNPEPMLGNLLAPVLFDWNGDGKDDLILGEGSYSANNIRLLENEGAANSPRFDGNNLRVLAYGMGLEQLAPALADFNGDGTNDLLVAESGGKIAVYLNKPGQEKSRDPLPFSGFIKLGGGLLEAAGKNPLEIRGTDGLLSPGGIFSIAAEDLDGDGLFDLVFGKQNGRIAISRNSGTKTEPKFEIPFELKGTAGTPKIDLPPGWEFETGRERGNFLGTLSVVNAQSDPASAPAGGSSCLRLGYCPNPNTILPAPGEKNLPAGEKTFKPSDIDTFYQDSLNNFRLHGVDGMVSKAPANFFSLKQSGNKDKAPFKIGQTYRLTMKTKGTGVGFARAFLAAVARLKGEEVEKQKTTDRGGVQRKRNETGSERTVFKQIDFSPGNTWNEISAELPVRFADKKIMDAKNDPALRIDWAVFVVAELKPGDGVLYLDDIEVTTKE